MPNFDMIDYGLMVVIVILAFLCYQCYNKENYAPLAYFTVTDPKYQVQSDNVMSAPIVYRGSDISDEAGKSVRPIPVSSDEKVPVTDQSVKAIPVSKNEMYKSGPVSPVKDETSEGFQYPLEADIKTIVPPHLSGGFIDPLSNPQMGFLPGGMEYGVSVPAMGNLSASVTSNSSPGSLNVWSSVI